MTGDVPRREVMTSYGVDPTSVAKVVCITSYSDILDITDITTQVRYYYTDTYSLWSFHFKRRLIIVA